MSDDILTDEDSDEGDSLSETIAAALEDQQGENIIAELGSAQDAAQETPETDGAGTGTEPADDRSADQTEEAAPPPSAAPEEVGATDEHRQVAEVYQAAVAPFQAYLASKGIAPVQAVRVLLAAEHQLSTGTPERKAQILAQLAKDYGVEIDALYGLEDVEPVSPELAQIQQRIGGIERLIAGERQQANAQVQQKAEAQVTVFAEKKDAQGTLLRPHLEEVRAAMGRMIEQDPKLTLEQAYENAVWSEPALREQALAKRRAAPATKGSKPGQKKPAKEPTLRDELLRQHRASTERANA